MTSSPSSIPPSGHSHHTPRTLTFTNWPLVNGKACHKVSNQIIDYSAQTATTSIAPANHPYTLHQIYHITYLLRTILVPDLVPPILDLASIHCSSAVVKQHPVLISRDSDSPYTYLVTPPLQIPTRTEFPISSVITTITAHDNGLDLNIGRSQFTLGVFRNYASPLTEDLDDSGSFQECGPENERVVVVNRSAGEVYETHVVEWRSDAADEAERGWVKNLKRGDRIVVRGWAQWASLENRVWRVGAEVRWRGVVR